MITFHERQFLVSGSGLRKAIKVLKDAKYYKLHTQTFKYFTIYELLRENTSFPQQSYKYIYYYNSIIDDECGCM